MRSAQGIVAGVLMLGLAATGCQSTVEQADVEEEISSKLGEQLGGEPDSVDCPEDLEAEEDHEMQCDLTVEGEDHTVNVTVTNVDGSEVEFDMVLDEEEGGGQGD